MKRLNWAWRPPAASFSPDSWHPWCRGGGNTRFSDFTPLPSSAGPTADEAEPITFGNPAFQQRSIASVQEQLAEGEPNSGDWDMNTVNETGPAQGPLPVHGVRDRPVRRPAPRPGDRRDRDDLAEPGAAAATSRFDASFWTPWGTYITAEESWCTAPAGCTTSPYGRLFELKNPLDAPGIRHR